MFFSLFSQLALADCPGGAIAKGWCWPTSAGEWTKALAWHGPNPGFSGPHLAKDISANEGDPVYPVDYGVVLVTRSDVGYYGGATNCRVVDGKDVVDKILGAGVVVRHYTSTGQAVDVLYAHLKELAVKKGDVIVPGSVIGKIRNYTWCGSRMDHLHLGVAYPARDLTVYERSTMNFWAGYGPSDLGFMNPEDFFRDNSNAGKIQPCNPSKERCNIRVSGTIGWFPPVDYCQQASQWYNMATVNGEKTVVGSTTKSFCPLVCYAN
ncbi:MAG: M23 family metallopeptidase [Candidatus Moraniibacteriota bacterium]